MRDSQKYGFKITIIGDGGVGKTSLIKKFTEGAFSTDYIKTIGAQFSKYSKKVKGAKIRLLFWDIAGQDDFLFLRPSFYKESSAGIIVYSLEETSLGEQSFENIQKWHEEIKKFCGDIPLVLFANKVDLIDVHTLNTSKIEAIIDDQNFLGYYLTSAKTGKGVVKAFNAIIEHLHDKNKNLNVPRPKEKKEKEIKVKEVKDKVIKVR
ncbi:hypothetical protein LCGC14_1094940 [marine sediment metagenome]|uniref:GTP-binding protein n=1 Tax=marine sediment metagenome TaxID=412755 RepID=A0A0F9PUB7_9ZZZZ